MPLDNRVLASLAEASSRPSILTQAYRRFTGGKPGADEIRMRMIADKLSRGEPVTEEERALAVSSMKSGLIDSGQAAAMTTANPYAKGKLTDKKYSEQIAAMKDRVNKMSLADVYEQSATNVPKPSTVNAVRSAQKGSIDKLNRILGITK